jgi:hypothetical protein
MTPLDSLALVRALQCVLSSLTSSLVYSMRLLFVVFSGVIRTATVSLTVAALRANHPNPEGDIFSHIWFAN